VARKQCLFNRDPFISGALPTALLMAGLFWIAGCGGGSGHFLPQVAAGTVSAPFDTSSGPANSSTATTPSSSLPVTSATAPSTAGSGSSTTSSDPGTGPSAPVTSGSGNTGSGTGSGSAVVPPAVPTISPSGPLPAFPGAQGGGAASVGGRGGQVMEVTNLNDSGSGSFRACAEGSGARTCIFRVGGTIMMQSPIQISSPNITVAGQSAPGGGILLSGQNDPGEGLMIHTHDVVVRYIRVRRGLNSARPPGSQSGSPIWLGNGDVYNVVVDHC